MIVTFAYPNDAVCDMDIGEEDGSGEGSPVRSTNPPNFSLVNANKQPEIMTFSYYVVVVLGKIGQESGEGSADERH